MAISYDERFVLAGQFAVADLALPAGLDRALRDALASHDDRAAIVGQVEQAVTAQLCEHGVDTDTGAWLGDWSPAGIVRDVLARRGIVFPEEG